MPSKPRAPSSFSSDNHVLYTGWVLGHLLKAVILAKPVVDADGNITNRVAVTTPEGVVVTLLIPPPPDDWRFTPTGTEGP